MSRCFVRAAAPGEKKKQGCDGEKKIKNKISFGERLLATPANIRKNDRLKTVKRRRSRRLMGSKGEKTSVGEIKKKKLKKKKEENNTIVCARSVVQTARVSARGRAAENSSRNWSFRQRLIASVGQISFSSINETE